MDNYEYMAMIDALSKNENSGTNINASSGTNINANMHMYSTPQLIDVLVTPTEVQLIYKRQLMVSIGYGMPKPEVYKVVYSRHDGSEKTIFGTYVPATGESYEF